MGLRMQVKSMVENEEIHVNCEIPYRHQESNFRYQCLVLCD